MDLKSLTNKLHFECKNITIKLNEKIQKHENFAFGIITTTNAITIPLADYLLKKIELILTSHKDCFIIGTKTEVRLLRFVFNISLIMPHYFFGLTLYLTNSFVISKLLKQNHSKWILLGSICLTFTRFKLQQSKREVKLDLVSRCLRKK